MKKWNFFKWTRDNQKRFADEIAAELDSKASKDAVDKLIADYVAKSGDKMTGTLEINMPPREKGEEYPIKFTTQFWEKSEKLSWYIGGSSISSILYIAYGKQVPLIGLSQHLGLFHMDSKLTLGYVERPWAKTFTKVLNNGTKDADIEIPAKAGTMALVSDIEDILRQHGLIPTETTEQEEQA